MMMMEIMMMMGLMMVMMMMGIMMIMKGCGGGLRVAVGGDLAPNPRGRRIKVSETAVVQR